MTKTGAGTTTLTGTNTYSGTTTISTGTLQVGNGGTTGTLGSGNITNNAALRVNRSDAFTLGQNISGTGTLTQFGAGTTTLTGANTYSGVTTISAGTLQVGNGGTTGQPGHRRRHEQCRPRIQSQQRPHDRAGDQRHRERADRPAREPQR